MPVLIAATRVADPRHFNADPDPSFHRNVYPDRIRILVKVMLICDDWSTVQTRQGSILSQYDAIVSVHGPPRLHFELLNVGFNADPDLDLAFHSNADPDSASQNNADPLRNAGVNPYCDLVHFWLSLWKL
jgi:hypothetical protein